MVIRDLIEEMVFQCEELTKEDRETAKELHCSGIIDCLNQFLTKIDEINNNVEEFDIRHKKLNSIFHNCRGILRSSLRPMLNRDRFPSARIELIYCIYAELERRIY